MRLIIIVVALVVALLVAFAVSGIFNQEQPAPEPQVLQTAPVQPEQKIEKVNIYVAQRDIPIGSVLSAADYDIKPWPSHLLPPGALLYGDAKVKLDGMITATPIVKDEPLLLAKLRNPNDPGFIAGQLKEGMRAVTISVNMIDSVAGFVQPGDKVDVMFTFDLVQNAIEGSDVTSTQQGSRGGDKQGNVSFSEVIMPNVKVLAVDQRVVAGGAQKDGQPAIPSSVTLEVNQRAAQKLKLADKMGKLSLVLRSIKDKDNFDRVRPTAEQDLTRILPPAYFPALFDSDAAYDFSVVDLYGNTLSDIANKGKEKDGKEKEKADPFVDVNVYRGTQLEKVEVKRP